MTPKEAIKSKIKDNFIQRDVNRLNSVDKLEFLVDEREKRISQFELSDSTVLKNSWRKKASNNLIGAIGGAVLTYAMLRYFNFDKWWTWAILIITILGTISFVVSLFETKIVLEIATNGLTLDNHVFNKWEDIEYLYYKTVYDGNGQLDGLYLVEKLKNGHEHNIRVDSLPWTKEKLGETLYHYMKKYGT
jgi:hypothetical protein